MATRENGYDAAGAPQATTTVAAAFAAASTTDVINNHYSDAVKNRFWFEQVSAGTTKVLGFSGDSAELPNRQCVFVPGAPTNEFYDMTGDLSGSGSQVTMQNLTIMYPSIAASNVIRWNDTTGGGQGIRVTNVLFIGGNTAVFFLAGDANVVQVDNCCVVGQSFSGLTFSRPGKAFFNTVVGCEGLGIFGGGLACTLTNNVCAWNGGNDFDNIGAATVTYCHSSDATADDNGGAGNVVNSGDPDDLDFWLDNNNSSFGQDYRILTSSDLFGAGIAIGGITTDCDGNTRADPPSIGWHEGTATAYPGTAPTFAGAAGITDNADRTLQLEWLAATVTTPDRYEVHLHTSSMSSGDLDARTYLVGSVENGILTFRAAVLADGLTRLTAGTLYYMAVRAFNGAEGDSNDVNLNTTVTDPRAVDGPLTTEIEGDPAFAMTAGADIYTCPGSKRAIVFVRAHNTDSSGRTVTPHVIPSGDSVADLNALDLAFALGIAGATDAKEKWGPLTLGPGDKVHALASVDSKVSIRVDGVEETLQ